MLSLGNWMTYVTISMPRKESPRSPCITLNGSYSICPFYSMHQYHLKPLRKYLKHHTDTLCSAQKQISQHHYCRMYQCFTGQDTILLEDWLMDIGTVADLTSEGRTKLTQAKSKGLTCSLLTEALSFSKSWEEIKDLLRLKICNSDIHTSISHFMEIQQEEKESLAAYIHHFKREA